MIKTNLLELNIKQYEHEYDKSTMHWGSTAGDLKYIPVFRYDRLENMVNHIVGPRNPI